MISCSEKEALMETEHLVKMKPKGIGTVILVIIKTF